MTLIVGIKCEEGVVVASDGSATMGNFAQSTIRQKTKKLSAINDKIIVGVSGPVGLGQIIKGEISALYDDNGLRGKKSYEAMKIISERIRNPILRELQVAQIARNATGNNNCLASAISSTLVAIPIENQPCLFQFDQQGAPEETTPELPFVCIGSGQLIADSFLGLMRRVFWPSSSPTVSEAVFTSFWALTHAIDVNPGGVDNPIQAMILTKNRGSWTVKELNEDELAENEDFIKAAEKHLATFKESVASDEGADEIPQPS